jgi:hypothetical protein
MTATAKPALRSALPQESMRARQRESAEILRARRLLSDDISIDRVWAELNDPRNHPTPQSIVEAVLHCVRERGIEALKEPVNVERLTRCDAAAKAQIEARIARIVARKEISK